MTGFKMKETLAQSKMDVGYIPPKRPNVPGVKLVVMSDWMAKRIMYPGLGERASEMYKDYVEVSGETDQLVSYKFFTEVFLFVAHERFGWYTVKKDARTRNVTVTQVSLRTSLIGVDNTYISSQ